MSARQVLDFVFTYSRKFDIGIKGILTRFTRQINQTPCILQKENYNGWGGIENNLKHIRR